MKVISTVNWEDHLIEGKEYEVLYMWKYRKRGRKGNSIYGYQVTMENGEDMWMLPEEGYVPLKTKKNAPWRKILKTMGYQKQIDSGLTVFWVNPTNGVELVESFIHHNNVIEYVKEMEEYYMMFNDYYMEMESIWTEGGLQYE